MTASFRKIVVVAVAALAVVGAAAAWKYLNGRQSANLLMLSGTVEADEIHIGSKVGGRIVAVLVSEGQEVKQGQSILRFDVYDLEARKADAIAAVAQADANLQKVLQWSRPEEIAAARAQAEALWMSLQEARNGPRKQEIDGARADLQAAEAEYELTRLSLKRVEELSRNGVVSRQDSDNAKAAFEQARGRRDSAKQRLDLLLAGTRTEEVERAERLYKQAAANKELVERGSRKEDIDSARAQLERAKAAVKQIQTQLDELEVKSPADAFIEVLRVRPGDLITPGSPVATLVELDRLYVRVFVPEPELAHAQLGKDVSVKVDTFPSESFQGRIESISSRGEFTPRNVQTREERNHQVFGLRVRLDNSLRRLRAGMAADVTIGK